ncbi:GNAT family N-acetyltransferase [Enterococcus sp. BWR-S5]|uniref:GNAT family N-acetyltransferase n=1 Tax=Enterococcus sp. BWR-S5 TaxID=2787714 RepID=UPI001924BBA8|nr:GNAT family N-acetyltransferase [Enterococcus sp. BWR-S5]MBL1224551.1 GNAT family N-acetyltransferase [Enterococcus sp. BWR-S5]
MIETNRLILRAFESTEKDIAALYEILADEEVNTYLPWFPLKSQKEALDFYHERIAKRNCSTEAGFYFAICFKEDNRPIGYVTASGEKNHDFGYGVRKDFWNRGVTTEAAAAVIDFLRNQGWPYITATHDINNPASGAVMKKLGLTYRYSYKEQWQPKNKQVTFRMYQLDFDEKNDTYQGYWEQYPEHFIEKGIE